MPIGRPPPPTSRGRRVPPPPPPPSEDTQADLPPPRPPQRVSAQVSREILGKISRPFGFTLPFRLQK